MSDNTTTDFFDGIGAGAGAPGPILHGVGDGVIGTIVEMFKRDYVPYENRKTGEPEKREDGTNKQQLVVLLQTEHRNWQNVSKVPKVDPSKDDSPEKNPGEDDGKRAIFVPEGKNIQFAIGRAVAASGKPFEVGGRLGVKITELRDTGKGNELKVHEALYEPKPVADGFFGGGQTASASQAAAQSAAAPETKPEPTPEPPAPATQQDPWSGSDAKPANDPPF